MLYLVTDYSVAHEAIAKAYAEAFNEWLWEELDAEGSAPDAEFEEVSSPRFYNFQTDRLFAKFDAGMIERVREVFVDDPTIWEKTCVDHFRSRDGFASFYNHRADDPAALLALPLDEWDHNELHALLSAFVRRQADEGIDFILYSEIYEAVYHAVDAAIDWPALTVRATEWLDEQVLDPEGLLSLWDDLSVAQRYSLYHALDPNTQAEVRKSLTELDTARLDRPRCELTLELPLP